VKGGGLFTDPAERAGIDVNALYSRFTAVAARLADTL